jgi:predicted DCC family thiol-disulfide oxidoreductase YuxK
MKAHVVHRPAVILYDRDCGLCTAGIGWLRRRVPDDAVIAMPFADAEADPRLSQLLGGRQLGVTIHAVLPDDRVLTGAAAVLAVGRSIKGWGALARLYDNVAGRALLEPIYGLVAANRARIGRALGIERVCARPAAVATGAARGG